MPPEAALNALGGREYNKDMTPHLVTRYAQNSAADIITTATPAIIVSKAGEDASFAAMQNDAARA